MKYLDGLWSCFVLGVFMIFYGFITLVASFIPLINYTWSEATLNAFESRKKKANTEGD